MPSAFAVLRQCSKPSVLSQKGLGGWARHVYTARRYSTSNGLPPLTVLLDMDECLIHSTFLGEATGARGGGRGRCAYRQAEAQPAAAAAAAGGVETFEVELATAERVRVAKRPGLDEFLAALAAEADLEVAVFTAAQQVYADPVLDRLDPARGVLRRRYYRGHCALQRGLYVKDLRAVSRDLARTVLVDNNPASFLAQPLNGLPVASWYGDDPRDRGLAGALEVLRLLKGHVDVQTSLQRTFRLDRALGAYRDHVYGNGPAAAAAAGGAVGGPIIP